MAPMHAIVFAMFFAVCHGQSCRYTNDGECDEPEGTGLCADGSDISDCNNGNGRTSGGSCISHSHSSGAACICDRGYEMVNNGAGLACSESSCSYTNDGDCDEPEGTGICAEGSDVADCGTGTCWEAHTPDYPGCAGYAMAGYTCVGSYCAAMDPGGTPSSCAGQAPGGAHVVHSSGRCSSHPTSNNSCRYANDGECDEPQFCARGTDCSDCNNCGGSGHRRMETFEAAMANPAKYKDFDFFERH